MVLKQEHACDKVWVVNYTQGGGVEERRRW